MGRGGSSGGHSGGGHSSHSSRGFSGGSSSRGFSSGGSHSSGGFSTGRGGGSSHSSSSHSYSGSSHSTSHSSNHYSTGHYSPGFMGPSYHQTYIPPASRPVVNVGPVFRPMGCLTRLVVMFIVATVLLAILGSCLAGIDNSRPSGYQSSGETVSGIAQSTVQREPLDAKVTVDAGYYTDEVDWIDNPSVLKSGLKYFYEKTGVMPYLIITDNLDGERDPSDAMAEAYCNEKYDELFTGKNGTDEAHLLVVFFEPYESDYSYYILAGNMAETVVDSEAREIIGSYIDGYYTDGSLDDNEYFAKVFEKSADRMMQVTKPGWFWPLMVLSIVSAVVVGFTIWARAKDKKIKEAEANAKILETPLQTYKEVGTDQTAEDLAQKYENS